MQKSPLSLNGIFRRAEALCGPQAAVRPRRPVSSTRPTACGAGCTRRLGSVLDALDISADGRVGTFAWNTPRHLELYFAAPCTGRVLHTLNMRLFADQLVYIANHAEDEIMFADRKHIARCCGRISTSARPVRRVLSWMTPAR